MENKVVIFFEIVANNIGSQLWDGILHLERNCVLAFCSVGTYFVHSDLRCCRDTYSKRCQPLDCICDC